MFFLFFMCKQDEEEFFLTKMSVFVARTQSQWGIVDTSPFSWRKAIFELSVMEVRLNHDHVSL